MGILYLLSPLITILVPYIILNLLNAKVSLWKYKIFIVPVI